MSFGDGPTKISDPALLSWFSNDSMNDLHASAQNMHENAATEALLQQSQGQDDPGNRVWAQDLAQRRLAVRGARLGSNETENNSLPAFSVDGNTEIPPAFDAAANKISGEAKETGLPPQLELSSDNRLDDTDSATVGGQADKTGKDAWSNLEQLAAPDSATSQKLKELGLYNDFNSPNCVEQMSWGQDSVSRICNTEQGARRTMMAYSDGTTSERAFDANGNLLYKLHRSGKLLDNSGNSAGSKSLDT